MDDTVELVNTEIEFDDKSLNEYKRNNLNIIAEIEANLKLFLTIRWQNVKKFRLPTIFDFDLLHEVRIKFHEILEINLLGFSKSIFLKVINQIEDQWNYWFERNPVYRTLYVDMIYIILIPFFFDLVLDHFMLLHINFCYFLY